MDTILNSGIRGHIDHHDHADGANASFGRVTPIRKQAASNRVVEPAAFGAGWYHDEAIEQARRDAIDARCNPYS